MPVGGHAHGREPHTTWVSVGWSVVSHPTERRPTGPTGPPGHTGGAVAALLLGAGAAGLLTLTLVLLLGGGAPRVTPAGLPGAGPVADWATAVVAGYSRVALVCVLVVAASGTAAALTQVTSVGDLFGSAYGLVIVLKASALVVLATAGLLQRRRVVARGLRGRRDFVLLAGSELVLMVLTFALAAGLSQTPPP